MKKHIFLILASSMISVQVSAFEQKDFEWFIMLNNCEKCDLSEANLEGIDLQKANLIGSSLRKAKL
ncbi:MAG: pentapeptide repeat-containing protein, partial [Deltaproteobacteria bacterium]